VADPGRPDGSVYEWYRRGLQLLEERHPDAAATLLAHAADAEPGSRSILEALARAQYDAGRYAEAIASFARLIALNPTDDYAHFGLGLAASRSGELRLAAEHLALAAAMRPDLHHYAQALRGVRARRAAGPS
jgi:Flp pilus assembly protein TadD